MHRLRRRISRAKQIKTIQFLVWRLAKEHSSFGTRYTRTMMGRCLLAPLLPFSSLFLPSFYFLSLLSLLPFSLPVFVLFSKTDLGKDAPGFRIAAIAMRMVRGTSIRRLWARAKHPYCARSLKTSLLARPKRKNEQNPLYLRN